MATAQQRKPDDASRPASLLGRVRGALYVAETAYREHNRDWIDGYKFALTRVEALLEDSDVLTVTPLPLPAEVDRTLETLEALSHAHRHHYTYRNTNVALRFEMAIRLVKEFRDKYNTELAER